MGRYVKNGKTIVTKDYPVAPANISQEQWDEIFPGKKKFEQDFGKIIKYRYVAGKEYYEYVCKNTGEIKDIVFTKRAD